MDKLFDTDLLQYIQSQNILIVGIGGIGCELLKGLLKFKFNSYHLVYFLNKVRFRHYRNI